MAENNEKLVRPMAITLKAVIIKGDEVLLLKRSNKELTNKGKWDIPGGHIEKGEVAKEALEREIKEETGLEVEAGELIAMTEFPKEHEGFKDEKRGLRFLAYYKSGEVRLDKNEHDEYLWLTIDEAIEKLNEKDGFEAEKRNALIEAKKYLEMKDSEGRWKRAVADLDNYKKRVSKEKEEFRKYCLENLILELLPVIDNFEMAIEHVPKEDKDNNWMVGVLHIKKQLENVLDGEGLERIKAKKGDKIDENIHDVIAGHSKKGKVKKVLKAGYKIGGRVIRAVSVEAE